MSNATGSSKTLTPQHRLGEIDALRGVAAVLVVLFHYTMHGAASGWPAAPPILRFNSGQIGIAIFFIISGFVISMTLERSRTALDFAVSRFARLYPSFWTCALLTTALVVATGFNPFHLTTAGFLSSMTMANGLTDLPPIDPSYWTLTRELIFYVTIASAYFLLGGRHLTAFVLGWLVVASAYNLLVADEHTYACRTGASCGAILLNATFAYLFAAGVMIYKLYAGERTRLVFVTLLAAIAAGSLSFWPTLGFQPIASLKAAGYACLVAGAAFGVLRVLRNRAMLFFGTISYALYLVHQVIGTFVISSLVARGVDANLAVLAAFLLITLLAAAVCYGVERPAQRAIRGAYAAPERRGESSGRRLVPSAAQS